MKILRCLLLLLLCLSSELVFAQLPHAVLTDIRGARLATDTVSNGGKPMVISFFATWCKPCLRELKAIHEVYDEWQSETGVKFVAVSIDQAQNIHKVRPLVDENGWQYEVWLDPNGELKRALGVQTIPFVVLLDGEGRIVWRHNGYTDGAEDELYAAIRKIAS